MKELKESRCNKTYLRDTAHHMFLFLYGTEKPLCIFIIPSGPRVTEVTKLEILKSVRRLGIYYTRYTVLYIFIYNIKSFWGAQSSKTWTTLLPFHRWRSSKPQTTEKIIEKKTMLPHSASIYLKALVLSMLDS